MILPPQPPPPLQQFLDTLSWFLDRRHSELLEPLFVGLLLAHGRRTATAWFRAAAIADDFRRAYTLIGTIGRSKCDSGATVLFSQLSRTIDPGPRWLFALDDTPTQRYGPCVEGPASITTPLPAPPINAMSMAMSG